MSRGVGGKILNDEYSLEGDGDGKDVASYKGVVSRVRGCEEIDMLEECLVEA